MQPNALGSKTWLFFTSWTQMQTSRLRVCVCLCYFGDQKLTDAWNLGVDEDKKTPLAWAT